MNLLSSELIKAARSDKTRLMPGRRPDGGGLYLNVDYSGMPKGMTKEEKALWIKTAPKQPSMSWCFIYTVGTKRFELGLGSLTGKGRAAQLGLAEARAMALELRVKRGKKEDLAETRKTVRKAVVAKAQMPLFSAVLKAFLDIKSAPGGWKDGPGTRLVWEQRFANHAKALLSIAVDQITTDDVVAVLTGMKPAWPSNMADKVQKHIENVFDYAVSKKHRADNPARLKGNLEHLLTGKHETGESRKAIDFRKMPEVFSRMQQEPFAGRTAFDALALYILTGGGSRSDNARLMQWSQINWEKATWTVDGVDMKEGVKHTIPLSTQALAILARLYERRVVGNDYVFPGSKAGQAINDSAMDEALCKPVQKGSKGVKASCGMGYRGEATLHGMRGSFRTWGKMMRFPRDLLEEAIAHKLKKEEAAYIHEQEVEARRPIMQAWADHCFGIAVGDNVLAFRKEAA